MPRNPRLRRVPDAIRIRVSRACAVCRTRKSRCIARHTGACERCVEKGEECDLYAPQASGSPTISSTVVASGHQMNASSPGGELMQEDTATSSSSQRAQVRVLGTPSAAQVTSEMSQTSMTSDCRAQTLNSQSPIPDVQSEDAILIVEDIGRTQYTGLRSNESFLLCVQDILHASTQRKALGIADRSSTEMCYTMRPPIVQSKESIEAMKAFPPQEIAAFLVSTFFYYVEATFFYCDREWFHTNLNSVFTGTTSGSAVDDAFICFALLVFAFGSQFAHLRSRTRSQDPLLSGLDPGKRFYDSAQKLIPRIIATCTLKGIQVCLLAGLYQLPYNLPDTSYLYLGMAMRISIASGLHRKTLAASFDSRTTEVRNRLWWSVYSIDKRTSIALGRPSSIAEDAIDAPFPKHHPSLDNLEYQSNVQHQIEYLKLTRIITRIVQNIPLETKPICIEDLSQQLKQWRSRLFSNLHPNDLLPSERNFRTTVHLHIHYHWAWILMGRASLLQVSREHIQALSNSALATPEQPQSRVDLATLCVDAAKATIELVLVLKKHNLLCRFSFTDHHASAAALIILILHSILKHRDETVRIIDDGIDMLRYMACGSCRGASSDLKTIEQLRRLASDLRQRIYQGEGVSSIGSAMQPTSMTDSYQAWVNWMSKQEASKDDVAGTEKSCSQSNSEVLHGASEMRAHERPSFCESGSSGNLLDGLDYSSLEHGVLNWNFDAFNGWSLQGEIPRGFEWDDGRLDVLDMTQLLGSHMGQGGYGQT